jgi:hypothetical protein
MFTQLFVVTVDTPIAIALKDVPDILTYAGAVVIKLPTDPPKTDDPVIYGSHHFPRFLMYFW